jgi:hypothetical protein
MLKEFFIDYGENKRESKVSVFAFNIIKQTKEFLKKYFLKNFLK